MYMQHGHTDKQHEQEAIFGSMQLPVSLLGTPISPPPSWTSRARIPKNFKVTAEKIVLGKADFSIEILNLPFH
jgi:hypothetical protein